MSIPNEIEYMILEYIPDSLLCSVCKSWNENIKNIRKKAVRLIENWYYSRLFKNTHRYNSVGNIMRYYVLYYPSEFFMMEPELIVSRLRINKSLLDLLPEHQYRKKSDVRNWILSLPLDLTDFIYLGW